MVQEFRSAAKEEPLKMRRRGGATNDGSTAEKRQRTEVDSRKPSEVTDCYWIFHSWSPPKQTVEELELAFATEYFAADIKEEFYIGKWMLFYPKSELDDAWEKAKTCQETRRFSYCGNAFSMKVSTFRPSPLAADPTQGVIIIYGNGFAPNVLAFGEKIAKAMEYHSTNGWMYFKTDSQTSAGSYSANGVRSSSLSMRVPRRPLPERRAGFDEEFLDSEIRSRVCS